VAAAIALIDLLIAAVVLLVASKSHPGPELDLAFEVRKMAVESIQADTRDLKLMLEALGQEVKNVPAALSILRGTALEERACVRGQTSGQANVSTPMAMPKGLVSRSHPRGARRHHDRRSCKCK